MSIIINSVQVVQDAVVEPVSLTDAKNWMRVTYDTDDDIIGDLLASARTHIEKLCGVSFVNKLIRSNFTISGTTQDVWIVDLPYAPLLCVNELKYKSGFTTYDILVKDTDYEQLGGKLWLYIPGTYVCLYQAGYGSVPDDIKSDILTLVAWSYDNRGKKFNGDPQGGNVTAYPFWDGLNFHQYKKIVI
jgi:hypothetical protein